MRRVVVQQGQAATVTFRPPAYWSSPTGKVVDKAGAVLEEPTPAVSTASTTVASSASNTQDLVLLTDATGFARGQRVRFTLADGETYADVSKVDGSTLYLTNPLPSVPDTGDAVRCIDVTVAVASSSTATRGRGYRVELRSGGDVLVQPMVVARYPWASPIDARRVREYIGDNWRSSSLLNDEAEMETLAQRAEDMILGRMLEQERFVDSFWSADAFEESGMAALKLVLVDKRLLPPGVDLEGYRKGLVFDLRDAVASLAHSAEVYDDDDDGGLDDDEDVPLASGRWTL